MEYKEKFNQLEKLIGNTPLIKIYYKYNNKINYIYTKLEYYNFTGSIKDRIVFNILKEKYKDNTINSSYELVEVTSGNTGISLAAIGAFLNNKVTIFMPNWMSKERIDLIKSFGANIILISKDDGGFIGCLEKAKEYVKNRKAYLLSQFENLLNTLTHYLFTSNEIINKINKIDAVCAGVGTGGTIMGLGLRLAGERGAKVFAIEPKNSPILRTKEKTSHHRILGISDEFIPPILRLDLVDGIIDIDDGDSIIMAQKIAKDLGIGVGISSGANFLGAIKLKEEYGYKEVLTVFPDDNKKYLSTDYSKEESLKEEFLSKDIELINFQIIN